MKKVLLSLVVASAVAFAGQGEYKSELSGYVGGVKPEGNLDLEDELNLGLRFGVYVEDKFFDMVEIGFERAGGVDYDNSSEDTDINRLFVDLVKEYDLNRDTALYGLVGVGYEDYKNPMYENDDDGFFQYGAGIKRWITDEFALKAEVRHGINFDGDSNMFYSLGFMIPIGKRAVEEIVVQPESIAIDNTLPPEPAPVVLKDDDNDGVFNKDDNCLSTPAGKVVDSKGCMKVIPLHVNFAYNKSDVPSGDIPRIKEVVSFMGENVNSTVSIDGYTDSVGSQKYNLTLSQQRAEAVADELVKNGVSQERISVKGHGESSPVATNETKEGRALNRRVHTSFSK